MKCKEKRQEKKEENWEEKREECRDEKRDEKRNEKNFSKKSALSFRKKLEKGKTVSEIANDLEDTEENISHLIKQFHLN